MQARLRTLLGQPSPRSWQQICRLLKGNPALVAFCRPALADWPDDIPRPPAPAWSDPLFYPGQTGALLLLQLANTLSGPPGIQRLEDDGAERIAACPHLAGLRTLRLADQDLSDAGVIALARSPHLSGLHHLDLCDNDLGPAAARVIVRAFPTLRTLRLAGCGLDDEAGLILARAPLSHLSHLEIDRNLLTDRTAQALAAASERANLTRLTLHGCRLTRAGRQALRTRWPDRRMLRC